MDPMMFLNMFGKYGGQSLLGNALGGSADILQGFIPSVESEDSKGSVYAKDIGSSVLSGAAAGTGIFPGVGTAIGAGVGLLGGALKGFFDNKQIEKEKEQEISHNALLRAAINPLQYRPVSYTESTFGVGGFNTTMI